MNEGLWFDIIKLEIAGRDTTGAPVVLVMADANGLPNFETAAAATWRAAGYGKGIDYLKRRWVEMRGTNELATRQFQARIRRADAVRELVQIAISTGDADALVEAMEQAEAADPGTRQIPPAVLTATRAVARLQNNALDAAETLVNPFDAGINKLVTAGKWGLGIWATVHLVKAFRGK